MIGASVQKSLERWYLRAFKPMDGAGTGPEREWFDDAQLGVYPFVRFVSRSVPGGVPVQGSIEDGSEPVMFVSGDLLRDVRTADRE